MLFGGGIRHLSCGPVLTKKTMFSSSAEVVSWSSESISVKTRLSSSACFVGETPRQRPSSFSVAVVRQQTEKADLKEQRNSRKKPL